jgi:hypothetical protein
MIGMLKQAQVGIPVAEVIRKAGISEQTFYRWKAKYAGLEVDEVRKIAQLQEENTRLKGEEIPRLCRGGSRSLTFTGVHPRNSRCEPTKAHVKEKLDGPIGESKSLRVGVQIPRSLYYNRENPRLCRGDRRCLTDPGVHPRNSKREPAKHTEGVSGWTSMTA